MRISTNLQLAKCRKVAGFIAILKSRRSPTLYKSLVSHLQNIKPESTSGRFILRYVSKKVLATPKSKSDTDIAIILVNALNQLGWIKCYYRSITMHEFETLQQSQGKEIHFTADANFSPSPFHPILQKYRQEISYADIIVMVPGIPGLEFTTHAPNRAFYERNWPRLKNTKYVAGHAVWILQENAPPQNARHLFQR